ncbi:protein FAR1-RELATED SEQUENCE 5-like [Malus domestica]|uniref:protein FAR1-RELATED SEQUENCE 5-like n=1 Tax=Malus domestica TaxID=3750 RepID=UPI0010AAE46B|nr:uncharacterized protein LOC103446568 [Malus domestica]
MTFGEVGVLLQYFSKQILENPSFYELQLDKEEQITNMFWADAKMIIDYSHFGDVVSFDTTYKVNELDRPFVVFVGFNHHKEIVVFGAALMYDETATSFKCACKNVNTLFRGEEGVHSQCFDKIFDHIKEESEFVAAWYSMLDEYDAHENDWVLTDTRYKEWEAEYDLQFRIVYAKFDIKLLKQAREVYTKAIFKLFQDQFEESIELSITNRVADGDNLYTVELDDKSKTYGEKGRWSKEAKVDSVVNMCGHEIQVKPKLQQAFRYKSLCSIFTRLSTRASENVKAYQLVIEQANKLAKMVEDLLHLEVNDDVHEKRHTNYNSQMANYLENVDVIIPKRLKKKEKSYRRRRRIRSALEKVLPRKKKSNQTALSALLLLPLSQTLHVGCRVIDHYTIFQIQTSMVPPPTTSK